MRFVRFLAPLALVVLGTIVAACAPASTPAPTPTLTVADPSLKPNGPTPTVEIPPPID
jgi:hypothetical protein